jgi:hypothetical protein
MFYDEKAIYVVDDFLTNHQQEFLEDLILDRKKDNHIGSTIPFYFNSNTNGKNQKNNPNIIVNKNTFDHYQFTHRLIEENKFISEYGQLILELFLKSFNEFFGCDDYDIFRCKINLSTPNSKFRKIVSPHIDSFQKMWSAVYYVNTVPNSYTLIGKDLYDGSIRNKFRLARKVETKKGRMVLFDSRRYHSAGKCPINQVRSVINFNIGKYEDL